MTCIYNPDNRTRALLKDYEDILGSYEAAYYVLSLNNGYSLEYTPDGKKSDLWVLLSNSMSREEAVRKKAMIYTKPFYDTLGDWTIGQADPTFLDLNGEPKLDIINGTNDPRVQDIMNNQFLVDDIDEKLDISDYQVDPIDLSKEGVALQRILSASYDLYVGEELRANPDASAIGVRKAKRKAAHEWYKRKVKQIIQELQVALAKAFGLQFVTNNDGSIEMRALEEYDNGPDKEIKLLRIKFIQNLNYDPLEDTRRSIFGEMPLNSRFKETDEHHQEYVADAVVDANRMDMFTAKNGLIYISLNNGTCATVNKVLAYHYITTYYDSKLIQSAINAVVTDLNASMMYKVNRLVDHLTEVGTYDATGSSILDKFYAQHKDLSEDAVKQAEFFNNFWLEFDELNDQVINKGIKSKLARNKILSTLAAAIITNNQLPAEMSIDMDIPRDYYFRYTPINKSLLRKTQTASELILLTLLDSYLNRVLHSEKTASVYVDPMQISRILRLLRAIEQADQYNPGEVREAILKFYQNACIEMAEAADKLHDAEHNTNRLEGAKLISVVYTDTIGFYKAIGNKIKNIISEHPYIMTLDLERLLTMFTRDINQLESHYNIILSDVCFAVVDKYVDQYIGDDILTPEEKNAYKANCHRWLLNQSLHGDISAYETILTMNSSSGSDIVRMVYDTIRNLDVRRDLEVREKAEVLMRMVYDTKKHLLKTGKLGTALLGSNFQRIFQETDKNGKPTGFITRRLNYGEFYRMRREFIDSTILLIVLKIQKDLGDTKFALEQDRRHNPIFPQDDFYEKYWKEYQLKLNHFDCTYGNKLYTEDYYELRINTLSRKTMDAVRDIEEDIDLILGPITKDGVPHPEELDSQDLMDLIRLLQMLEGLYSRYYITGEYKNGDDLQISEELRKFRDLVKDDREYETDWGRYHDVLSNLSKEKVNKFKAFMSHIQLSNQFWDTYNTLKEEYRAQFPPECDDIFKRMDEINKERRELTLYAQTGEYNTCNIDVLPDEVFLKIRDLDIEFRDLSNSLAEYRKDLGEDAKKSPSELLAAFELYETTPGSKVSKFLLMMDDARKLDEEEYNKNGVITTENIRRAISLYTIPYYDSNGQIRYSPTSIFSYMTYLKSIRTEIVNRFNLDLPNLLQEKPNKVFNKLTGGKYMNTKFDQKSFERLLPKLKNPQYDVIMGDPKLESLYNKILEIMTLANAMTPNTRNNSNYRLPQIGASTATVWSRCDIYNPLPAIQYGLDRAFNVNETDTEINDDFYTLPDGTRVSNVPLRFIQMLEDPSTITADVVGSVIAYYNMAVNFKLKSLAAPLLELLKLQVGKSANAGGVDFEGTSTSQYSKLSNVIDSRLYDRDKVWFNDETKRLSTGLKRAFKAAKNVTTGLVVSALSHNFLSYTTGFWDASSRFFVNGIQGDNFNKGNWFRGVSVMTGYLADGQLLAGIGSHFPTTNASMLMSYLGISVGTAEYFRDSHKSRFRRSMKEVKTGMAGFRVSDYMINGALTTAICDNYRYYENEDGTGIFLQENEWINRYIRLHPTKTVSQARTEYLKSEAFFDAFIYDRKIPVYGNIFQARLKDKYNNVSAKDLQSIKINIRKTVENLAAKFNGAVPPSDKPVLHQNPFMRVISTLRNYLINDFQTRWEYGESFLTENTSKASIKEKLAKLDKLIKIRNERRKLYKHLGKDELEAIEVLDKKLKDLNEELRASVADKTVFNTKYLTDASKSFAMGAITAASFAAPIDFALTLLFPSTHEYSFILSCLLGGTVASVALIVKDVKSKAPLFLKKNVTTSDKIEALEELKRKILDGSDDLLDINIANAKRDLWDTKNQHNQRKGVYNYELRRKAYGYNRAFGSAVITLCRELKFFYMRRFAKDWKDLSDIDIIKYTPKLTKIEKTGVRRILGDISNILLWMIISSIMFGWKNDDPENVLPAKIADNAINVVSDNDHTTRDILSSAYGYADDAVTSFWDAALNNRPVQGTAEWMYDIVTHGDKMPRDNNVFERMIESKLNLILGKKISVKTKTGNAVYKDVANTELMLDLTKSYGAVQTVRIFTETAQPYDPTSMNDMLSTTSASNNVGFKMVEHAVQQGVDGINGVSDKLVQRSPYTGFTKSQYHFARWALRPTGLPTLHEETTIPGLDNRLRYSTNLGLNLIIFQKSEDAGKKKKNNARTNNKKKLSPRKPAY